MDFLIKEPSHIYHEKAAQFLSSHQLADFRNCPRLYRKKKLGLIPDVDRPAYAIGRAAHTMILEGQKVFDAEYEIGGPINDKTGKPYGATTKKYAEWAYAHGKQTLTDSQYALLCQMNEGVRTHEFAVKLLSEGTPEAVVRHEYEAEECQIRMDWFNPDLGVVDLKTCDNLQWFEADAKRYGYMFQLAFYRSVLRMATETEYPVHIIAVEKTEPFRCGVWKILASVLNSREKDNASAIRRLHESREKEEWITGYEDVRMFNFENSV